MNRSLNFLFVILVIIILAYVFAPEPEDYSDKLRVVQGIQVASVARAAVNEYWQETGQLPDHGDLEREKILVQVDLQPTPVENITIGVPAPGNVTIHFKRDNDQAENPPPVVTLIPTPQPDRLAWHCHSNAPAANLPRVCRITGEN